MRNKIITPKKAKHCVAGTTCLMMSKNKRRRAPLYSGKRKLTQFWQDDDERRRRKFNHALGFFGTKKTPRPQMGKKQCKKQKRSNTAKKTLDWLPMVGAGARMAVMDSYNLNRPSKQLDPETPINY